MNDFLTHFYGLIGIVGTIIGGIGTFFAFLAFKESRATKRAVEEQNIRNNEPITIRLQETEGAKRSHSLAPLRRQSVTRGEIQGRIGVVPLFSGTAYRIGYLNDKRFFAAIDKIAGESATELIIECTTDEFNQFNIIETQTAPKTEQSPKPKRQRHGK